MSKHRKEKLQKFPPKSTNLIHFSFLNDRNIFESILLGKNSKNKLIDDIQDFWRFVNKYEDMLRKSGRPVLPDPFNMSHHTAHPKEFQKVFLNCFELNFDEDDKSKYPTNQYSVSGNTNPITSYEIEQFNEIVLLYIDFKQKEKFQKLKKIRQGQQSLPVHLYKDTFRDAVENHQVIIVAGDTGCGKSTQIPQFLHEFGYTQIACTQPRRLACIALCKRVAHEMLNSYNNTVGYQIRFERSKTTNTEISFITEGLLLRQFGLDSNLENYDVIILDEIHERNLYGDFLLGVAKCLLKSRSNLKLILMSATINVGLFTKYFEDENVCLIEVPGRLFPIKLIYQAIDTTKKLEKALSSRNYESQFNPDAQAQAKSSKQREKFDPEPYIKILNVIVEKYPDTERGDVLIFVSGVHEIEIIIEAGKAYDEKNENWIFLPLHSGLSLEEQDKVFNIPPDGIRKCIVSTNIAETSLTLAGVRFVIDSGKVKEMNYDPQSKTQRLKEFIISKSSADQRKGRAGRTGPGICYRLYTEKDYEDFDDYPVPEIRRVPLENMLLQMVSMGLQNVRIFPFVEAPPEKSIEQSIVVLKQHDALSFDEKISTLGKALVELPVELSIGKMLLMGLMIYDIEKVITVASVLSIQSIFTNRAFTDHNCKEARYGLESQHGDFFTAINMYKYWLEEKCQRTSNTRDFCRKMGIEEQRFYEITKLRRQFKSILENSSLIPEDKSEKPASSAERAIRHGELRILRTIKRVSKYEAIEDDRKRVKKDPNHKQKEDLRDVDFRLSQDLRNLKLIIKSTEMKSAKDVLLLKLIVTSGFYPNLAVSDEFNYCKSETQQFFHTISKPFVSIHPNAQLCYHLDAIRLTEIDIVKERPAYYTQKLVLSSFHKILCYQSLLETTKSYLINPFYLPAAPTLFLFAYNIDTNMAITKVVCDSWLCLEFPIGGAGQDLLRKSIQVRKRWSQLLNDRLDNKNIMNKLSQKRWDKLLEEIIAFMNFDCIYTIKRLLPADIKNLYSCAEISPDVFNENPFCDEFQMTQNLEKGGINVAANVTFGCIREESWTLDMDRALEDETWTCSECKQSVALCGIFKLAHISACSKVSSSKSTIKKDDKSSEN